MIIVDSSVWIDHFQGAETAEADYLDLLIGRQTIVIGDLVLAEVLQGFTSASDYARALSELRTLPVIDVVGENVALLAITFYRDLRGRGCTIRKTIDTLIATRCIVDGLTLLHRDRDFDPFVEHLGLQVCDVGLH